jgi:hypothetical protein
MHKGSLAQERTDSSLKGETSMKRVLRPKLIVSLLTGGLLASTLAISLLFGSLGRSSAASPNGNTHRPEGSWLVKVTATAGQQTESFQLLETYDAGGGLVETDQTDFHPQFLISPGHGAWISRGEDGFASTWVAFFFDAKGNPRGSEKIREVDTFSEGGNAYNGSGKFEIVDVNGKVIEAGTFTAHARRIQVEAL